MSADTSCAPEIHIIDQYSRLLNNPSGVNSNPSGRIAILENISGSGTRSGIRSGEIYGAVYGRIYGPMCDTIHHYGRRPLAASTAVRRPPTVVDSIVVDGVTYGTIYPTIYGTINHTRSNTDLVPLK